MSHMRYAVINRTHIEIRIFKTLVKDIFFKKMRIFFYLNIETLQVLDFIYNKIRYRVVI
jgi:hypothetical protein